MENSSHLGSWHKPEWLGLWGVRGVAGGYKAIDLPKQEPGHDEVPPLRVRFQAALWCHQDDSILPQGLQAGRDRGTISQAGSPL